MNRDLEKRPMNMKRECACIHEPRFWNKTRKETYIYERSGKMKCAVLGKDGARCRCDKHVKKELNT